MCGLAGFFTHNFPACGELTVRRMGGALVHRGPDDSGLWLDKHAGIALAHRRLSILDLSPAGHQPMISATGRYVIAFNGEIYNHQIIRDELEQARVAPPWRGHSDTETLLASFEAWGIEGTLKRIVGMFAIALWDRAELALYLARDRMGEKPLYYGWMAGNLLFGSELKALRAHPDWNAEIDRNALALYMRHNYVPAPYTIYQAIYKLAPGAVIRFDAHMPRGTLPVPRQYWSALAVVGGAVREGFAGDDAEAALEIERLLSASIRQQMIADVPLGAFLSGGIDSSTIVALMQANSSRAVKTFTIGFSEASYNEAEYAQAVAERLGTEHTELYVTPEEAIAVIPRLPRLYDEPFSDSSQIPTFLVSQLAREHVTVALSGDAGDELFGGYNRYFLATDLWKVLRVLPWRIRRLMAGVIRNAPTTSWDNLSGIASLLLPKPSRKNNAGDRLHKLAEILSVSTFEQLYHGLVSHWKDATSVVLDSEEPPTVLTDRSQWADVPDIVQRMMFLDTVTYLPDDILVKVDRAAMGVGLETRIPLLDHRLFEFAWRLPQTMKVRDGQGKCILRKILYKYVPKELIERPKMGFGVPIGSWLRGPLKEWAEGLLDEGRLRREGFFNPKPIRQKWSEHLSGRRNWQYHLWDVLMFQAWMESQASNN